MLVERKVKVVTDQSVIDKPSPVAEFPMREWSIKLHLLDEDGNERPADVFTKVVYNLHPTLHQAPFICSNEGWGEFEISIDCYTTEKTKLAPIIHDLNFQQEHYEADRPKKKGLATKKGAQKYDCEKIAEALQKLDDEEDLLRVIQLINENKSAETYIKSDVEAGEFSIDLYTMPDVLCTKLWEHLSKKNLIS
ncbi:hypothetical protein ACCO45_008832 [Purpureocillium lilacinum]|uniref:Uncharacterized protein n=1 Tax=Purpureocillium lilacinum TaxID=33203 RepID=A0ACC4DIB3_PURLI